MNNQVKLVWTTPSGQDLIVKMARVSNPSGAKKGENNAKLIKYLLDNKHFSPFTMANMCISVHTSRAIFRQIYRHASMPFVEFETQEFCLAGDTEITFKEPVLGNHNHKLSSIYTNFDYYYDKEIKCWDLSTNQPIWGRLKKSFCNGKKVVYRLGVNSSGLTATGNHKLLTNNGWRTIHDLIEDPQEILLLGTRGVPTIEQLEQPVYVYDLQVDTPDSAYVAHEFIVHNSGRYATYDKLSDDYTPGKIKARTPHPTNRQLSIDTEDLELINWWDDVQEDVLELCNGRYQEAIDQGIASEVARMILPEGLTPTHFYLNGNIRSWYHFCEARRYSGAQKEVREIAEEIYKIGMNFYPDVFSHLGDAV
jgi:flavin-dependent thymidylate synthase